jgi:hypothetical protein
MKSKLKTTAKWIGIYLGAQMIGGLVEAISHSRMLGMMVTVAIIGGLALYSWQPRRVRQEIGDD